MTKNERISLGVKLAHQKNPSWGFQLGNQVNKGRKLSEDHKKEISRSMKGGNSTSFRKGYIPTNSWREKQSILKMGANNPKWLGGITILKKKIRVCYFYRNWRKSVFDRDGRECVLCNSSEFIQADHIKLFSVILKEKKIKSVEDAVACKELWDLSNGRTLCKKCHKKETYGHD